MSEGKRLFIKITREYLPQIKDKYPFLYLEHGRLEIDDSSIKWIDADKNVVPLPIATLNTLLLGPGTTITHEAIKVATSANCSICWVGNDSLLFYAAGLTPTSDTRNMQHQLAMYSDPEKSLEVVKKLFSYRFPESSLDGKNKQEIMGMEGHRVRALYQRKADEYQIEWKGRQYSPGNFNSSDLTNQILTANNAALYGILCSAVHSLGFSPHIGFIHSGSPLPFIYDLSDLYKENLCIDLAFALSKELKGKYDRKIITDCFRQRIIDMDLLVKISSDIFTILGMQHAHNSSK